MMTTAKMAQAAYGAQSVPVRTERGIEYAVFSQITRRMKAAADRGADGFADLAAALHDNRQLWTLLAIDVADAGNAMPRDLRARIAFLAKFTLHHTGKVLAGEDAVDPLIEVNAAIMRGLLGQPDRPRAVATTEGTAR